jgi:hypothetical protein
MGVGLANSISTRGFFWFQLEELLSAGFHCGKTKLVLGMMRERKGTPVCMPLPKIAFDECVYPLR